MHYQNKQVGKFIIVISAIFVVGLIGLLLSTDFPPLAFLPALCIFLILPLIFASLTTQIDSNKITLKFGTGLIKKTIPLSNIESAKAVTNKWIYGWGIRITPHGWLWNIKGLEAVEITYKNGKKFRIGSGEPEALLKAINEKLA